MGAARRRRGGWIRRVQETSNALDLPEGLFRGSPEEIARGLKRAAERSPRTRARTKFQSAMFMLNWFINRAGRGLSPERCARLERAKAALRRAFGRE
jgi:hypothetical protein